MLASISLQVPWRDIPLSLAGLASDLIFADGTKMASLSSLCRAFSSVTLQRSSLHVTRPVASARSLSSHPSAQFSALMHRPQVALASHGGSNRTFSAENVPQPTPIEPKILQSDDGRQFLALDTTRYPKLKPSIIRRRLDKMKTYEGAEKNIRHSPWKLNLSCQLAAKLPLQEALTQLEFNKKKGAAIVQKVLKRTSNLADIRHGLQPSQLEVAECFATKGTPLKRVKPMGRGRSGRMEHKHAHMRVVLREIDFKLKIVTARSLNQKKKWYLLQQQAKHDYEQAKAQRDELERLERETQKVDATK